MKVAVVFLFAGIVACALANDNSEEIMKEKSLTKETKDQVSTTASSDIAASASTTASDGMSSSTTQSGDSSSTSTKPGDQAKPRFCTRQYSPVCSSNGKTFNNQCEFENAQKLDSSLTVTKTGTC